MNVIYIITLHSLSITTLDSINISMCKQTLTQSKLLSRCSCRLGTFYACAHTRHTNFILYLCFFPYFFWICKNRLHTWWCAESDDYGWFGQIHVELWVEGAQHHNNVNIDADRSLVGYDHGQGTTGVDIYLAAYGTLFQREGNVLVTIFLNSGHPNSTHPNSTAPTLELE